MQQKLVLYIGNVSVYTEDERVDQFKDESVSFTQTIQNVKDIKKIFTEFTKTFALPASKKNNKIFDHYYNYDIVNGFDARTKVNASLELNDIPFKTGKIALTGVDLKNNVPHTYKITFYGNTVNLKDILGDQQLSSLGSLNSYNTNYDYTSIKNGIQSAAGSDLIVPLITNSQRLTYDSASDEYGNMYWQSTANDRGVLYTEFKYALRLQAIIDAIETDYGLQFSNDFFNNPSETDFYNLYMWLHRKKGNVEQETQVERVETQVYNLNTTFTNDLFGETPVSQVLGYVTTSYPSQWTNQRIRVTFTPSNLTQDYSVNIYRIGYGIIRSFVNEQGIQNIDFGYGEPYAPNNSSYYITISSATPLTFTAGNIDWNYKADNYDAPLGQQTPEVNFSNSISFTTSSSIQFNIPAQIPEMKIIDFLSALFQTFNLTAYVENDIIVVKRLDSYYSVGSLISLDKYIDVEKSQVNIALPFKKIKFGFEGVNTFLAKQFNQLTNGTWGGTSYSLNNDLFDTPEKDYEIKIPFEHVLYERLYNQDGGASTTLMYGYFTDDNQEPYYGKPLIFYGYKYQSLNATSFPLKESLVLKEKITNYWLPMNTKTLEPTGSLTSLHFDVEQSEWLANESGSNSESFTDTLFEKQYSTYINEVFTEKRRLTKVTAYLPYKIFSSLQLNDRVSIGQNTYKINSMTTNLTTGKTEFELLNTDL